MMCSTELRMWIRMASAVSSGSPERRASMILMCSRWICSSRIHPYWLTKWILRRLTWSLMVRYAVSSRLLPMLLKMKP